MAQTENKTIAVVCNNEIEFEDAQKVIHPQSYIKWRDCTGYPNQRVSISKNGWCGDQWFREHGNYTVIEYSDWKKSFNPTTNTIINNYPIY